MKLLAATFAVISGITGLYISYYAGIASGAAIVLVTTVVFAIVWSIQQLKNRIMNISGS